MSRSMAAHFVKLLLVAFCTKFCQSLKTEEQMRGNSPHVAVYVSDKSQTVKPKPENTMSRPAAARARLDCGTVATKELFGKAAVLKVS